MVRFGWASGGYKKNQVEKGGRETVRRRSGACVSALALMTSVALGVPIHAKKAMAEGGAKSIGMTVSCGTDSDCTNNDTVSILGGGGRTSGMELIITPSDSSTDFSMTNGSAGTLDVKSGSGGGQNPVAHGQYVEVGSSGSGAAVNSKSVTMRNDGSITTKALSSNGSTDSGSGMKASVVGNSNTVNIINNGQISSEGYKNPSPPMGGSPFGASASALGLSSSVKGDRNQIRLKNLADGTVSVQAFGRTSYSIGMLVSLQTTMDADVSLVNEGLVKTTVGGGLPGQP